MSLFYYCVSSGAGTLHWFRLRRDTPVAFLFLSFFRFYVDGHDELMPYCVTF